MFTLVLVFMQHRNIAFVLELHEEAVWFPCFSHNMLYADIITQYSDQISTAVECLSKAK